jgi:hypothetical protein
VDEFVIHSTDGEGQLIFFSREPGSRNQPIEGFSVRIIDQNLSAVARVCAGCMNAHPAPLFAEMARRWQGWRDELKWRSLEYELALHCNHDRLGHIRIGVRLRSDCIDGWEVKTYVMAEAGQLERLARQATEFFGEPRDSEFDFFA